jgi:hypothetical protein
VHGWGGSRPGGGKDKQGQAQPQDPGEQPA